MDTITTGTESLTISRVTRDNAGRPTWTVDYHDGIDTHTVQWRTDSNGEGLWIVKDGGDRQEAGHCQYRHTGRAKMVATMARFYGMDAR